MTRLIEEGIQDIERGIQAAEAEAKAAEALRKALPQDQHETAIAAVAPAIQAAQQGRSTGEDKSKGPEAADALQKMVAYIPTEIVTLYVAACAAYASLGELGISRLGLYWGFVLATPVVFVLILLGKRRSAGKPAIPPPGERPWFRMMAATIAFAVWALAVPEPGGTQAVPGPLAALGALVVSTLLALCEPVFGLRKKAAQA